MTTRGKNGCQSEKTAEEGIRYMLDNKIGTDVSIEVGPPDGEIVTFRAHKFILISRSEVFEGMFSSGMIECSGEAEAKIRIEDIDADIFEEVLDYMYCKRKPIDKESALSVMYAAKKYMLSKLVGECCRCLLEGLAMTNVIEYLEYSLRLDEHQLQRACLKLISVNARAVLSGTEILSASRLVLKAILEEKSIPVQESVIYEAAVKWAKHQLKLAKPQEDPTGLQIRETLGDLLYKIRFPTMKPTEFAGISSENDLLTAEEKESIYYFLTTRKIDRQLKFPIMRRTGEEVWIDRTVNHGKYEWHGGEQVDAINFSTNADILLTGIGLYPGFYERGYDVAVEILQAFNSMYKKRVKVPHSKESTPFKILLDNPVGLFIKAGDIYSVKARPFDAIGYCGYACEAVSTKGTVTFTFSRHPETRWTTETFGQIPRFYFNLL